MGNYKYMYFNVFCRLKLEVCMQQWQGYDELYDTLEKWVKDTEVKVRNESELKPNLAAKQAQLDTFKVGLLVVIEAHLFRIFSFYFRIK